jgi:hypothetical protein
MEDIQEIDFTPDGIKPVNITRSKASAKAWETRRRRAQAELQSKPNGGMTEEQAKEFRAFLQRLWEKREELASVQSDLESMEAELDRRVAAMTVK